MIWLKIIGGLFLIWTVVKLRISRKLTLENLKLLLSLNEKQRLHFSSSRDFSGFIGRDTAQDYWLDRWTGDALFFPHDKQYIEIFNERVMKDAEISQIVEPNFSSEDFIKSNLAQYIEPDYISYRLKGQSGISFLKKVLNDGFLLQENIDIEKEGLSSFEIHKFKGGGYFSYSNDDRFVFYKNSKYGLIHRFNQKANYHFFTLYNL